jgi:hypothetical protein
MNVKVETLKFILINFLLFDSRKLTSEKLSIAGDFLVDLKV